MSYLNKSFFKDSKSAQLKLKRLSVERRHNEREINHVPNNAKEIIYNADDEIEKQSEELKDFSLLKVSFKSECQNIEKHKEETLQEKFLSSNSIAKSSTFQTHQQFLDPNFIHDLLGDYESKTREREEKLEVEQKLAQLHSDHRKRLEENAMKDLCSEFENLLKDLHIEASECYVPKPQRKSESDNDEEEEEKETDYVMPELSVELLMQLRKRLKLSNDEQEIVTEFKHVVTKKEICSLNPNTWLTDMVINFYLALIQQRSFAQPEQEAEDKAAENDANTRKRRKMRKPLPRIQFVNTFFYSKLREAGYAGVRRWTRRSQIFSHDLLLIPVHLGNHWCLACIDFRARSVTYYDSLGGKNQQCLSLLRTFLVEESRDKLQKDLDDIDEWKFEHCEDFPQQSNGYDCGVFLCVAAEYLSRDSKLSFTCKQMEYFRQKMMIEIFQKRLLSPK